MARELIDVEVARRIVLEHTKRLEDEEVPLRTALGRVLAAGVEATEPIPPFDNSAMDGYAVRAGDTAAASPGDPVRLTAPARRSPSRREPRFPAAATRWSARRTCMQWMA